MYSVDELGIEKDIRELLDLKFEKENLQEVAADKQEGGKQKSVEKDSLKDALLRACMKIDSLRLELGSVVIDDDESGKVKLNMKNFCKCYRKASDVVSILFNIINEYELNEDFFEAYFGNKTEVEILIPSNDDLESIR